MSRSFFVKEKLEFWKIYGHTILLKRGAYIVNFDCKSNMFTVKKIKNYKDDEDFE